MNKFSILLVAFCLILFLSCSNDDDVTETPIEEANYYALSVGNSWTYNVFRYDAMTMEYVEQDFLVNGKITQTELINGEIYYNMESTIEGTGTCDICLDVIGNKSLRDSLGYLIDSNGSRTFTIEDTEPYLISQESFGDVYGEYDPSVTNLSTPLRDFENIDYNKTYAVFEDGSISAGTEKTYYKNGEGLQAREIAFVNSGNPFYMFALSESIIVED
jgi:hypothetical protein